MVVSKWWKRAKHPTKARVKIPNGVLPWPFINWIILLCSFCLIYFKCTGIWSFDQNIFSHKVSVDNIPGNHNAPSDTQGSVTEVPVESCKPTSEVLSHSKDSAVKSSCSSTSLTEIHKTPINVKICFRQFLKQTIMKLVVSWSEKLKKEQREVTWSRSYK